MPTTHASPPAHPPIPYARPPHASPPAHHPSCMHSHHACLYLPVHHSPPAHMPTTHLPTSPHNPHQQQGRSTPRSSVSTPTKRGFVFFTASQPQRTDANSPSKFLFFSHPAPVSQQWRSAPSFSPSRLTPTHVMATTPKMAAGVALRHVY